MEGVDVESIIIVGFLFSQRFQNLFSGSFNSRIIWKRINVFSIFSEHPFKVQPFPTNWKLFVFNAVFNIFSVMQQWPVYLGIFAFQFLLPVPHTTFFPSHRLLWHITVVETMVSAKRRIRNLWVTMRNNSFSIPPHLVGPLAEAPYQVWSDCDA